MIEGRPLPRFVLTDSVGQPRALPVGRSCVLVVEDDTSQLRRQRAHEIIGRHPIEVVAIAEVARYRLWPARTFALAAVRKTEAQEGVTVWLDWHDAVRTALAILPGQSAFVVLDDAGRVVFFAQGQLDEAREHALDEALARVEAVSP